MFKFKVWLLILCIFCGTAEAKYTDETVKVTRVIDGDTIEIIYQEEIEVVRLYGIDCPEKGEDGFEKAKQYTENQILSSSNVVLLKFPKGLKKKRDHFGRLLAIIEVDVPYTNVHNKSITMKFTESLNLLLVDSKNAVLVNNMTLGKISNNKVLSIDELLSNDVNKSASNNNGADTQETSHDDLLSPEEAFGFLAKLTPEKLQQLIYRGGDINSITPENMNSLLLYLVQFNFNSEVVDMLLKSGAEVNTIGFMKNTPLHIASAYNKNSKVIDLLLRNGANVNAKDNSGFTPLHDAVYNSSNIEIVKILIHNGADINALDNIGQTPLDYARMKGNSTLITVLIKAGADTAIREDTSINSVMARYHKAK